MKSFKVTESATAKISFTSYSINPTANKSDFFGRSDFLVDTKKIFDAKMNLG